MKSKNVCLCFGLGVCLYLLNIFVASIFGSLLRSFGYQYSSSENAFSGCTSLVSVTILPGVKTIWGGAFSDCSSLVSVSIPESVTEIKGQAFSFCTSLQEITISSSLSNNNRVTSFVIQKIFTLYDIHNQIM